MYNLFNWCFILYTLSWFNPYVYSLFQGYSAVEGSLKTESESNETLINIRQRVQRTNRPRKKTKNKFKQCKDVLDNLVFAMAPLNVSAEGSTYWFFGRHVTERLNALRPIDAKCARREILKLLEGNINDETGICSLGSWNNLLDFEWNQKEIRYFLRLRQKGALIRRLTISSVKRNHNELMIMNLLSSNCQLLLVRYISPDW